LRSLSATNSGPLSDRLASFKKCCFAPTIVVKETPFSADYHFEMPADSDSAQGISQTTFLIEKNLMHQGENLAFPDLECRFRPVKELACEASNPLNPFCSSFLL
jgi:hypothetical protein